MSQTGKSNRFRSRGFSTVELLVVVAIIFIMASAAIISIRGALPAIRANAGLTQVVGEIRGARERAIAQRRNIQLTFPNGVNQVRLTQLDVVGTTTSGTTVISDVTLTNNMQFMIFPGVSDTPDSFGANSALDFGGSPTLMFMSDGTFVDASGTPLNGTIFLGIPAQPGSQRAVTILGATGRIRGYKWNGARWVE